MATFFPERPKEGAPVAEARVWQALERLDASWRVFHSVAWQSMRGGREADGEADFVLIHPQHGLIVLEVKGGVVKVDSGQWHSRNQSSGQVSRIKNPFDQAKDSKYALIKHLGEIFPSSLRISVCHGVVFPYTSVEGFVGLDAPRDITIDASDLLDMPGAIARLIRHWEATSRLADADIKRMTAMLAPTTSITTSLKARIAGALFEQIELTGRQIHALAQLKRVRRAAILGPAGSGKTILAVERARQLARDGFDVLLTCYNRPLGEKLKMEFAESDPITVVHFHGLVAKELGRAGLSMPADPSPEWWDKETVPLLLEAIAKTGTTFGALVVDEAQDFSAEWLDALTLMLRDPDEGPVTVFADTLQAIYHKEGGIPTDWPPIELDINCRSTVQIAKKVGRVFGSAVASLGAEGPNPQFVRARNEDEALEVIPQLVDNLVTSEHLLPEQIVVVSGTARQAERLRQTVAGDHAFVELGKAGVVSETIHRFKGLEADVIIVSLAGLELKEERHRALAYVGMSRARGMLFVLGSKESQDALNWAGNT